ncbi:ABC transporter permease [Telmatobacter bradus]|uniref:ABC transporter permease n=1 Tax=Telmatobacter bradus TaxID=474953 RepID=UPI003B432C77
MNKSIYRIPEALLSVWALLTAVFFLTRTLGDPSVLLLPIGASKADAALFRAQLGLDLPLWKQYLHYIEQTLHGNLGESFLFARPALGVVLERLPATLLLASTALFLGMAIGLAIGSLLAIRRHGILHRVLAAFVILGQATPVFWLGMVLILLFAVQLHWLPTGGYGHWKNLILPSVSMALFLSAHIARMAESTIKQVLHENYVRTARAKGLSPLSIYLWYVLRSALVPIVTLIGILAGEMIGGSVVVETIFAWPGIGRLIYQAIENQDFPVVSAGIVLISVGVIAINFLADMVHLWLDPRIRTHA